MKKAKRKIVNKKIIVRSGWCLWEFISLLPFLFLFSNTGLPTLADFLCFTCIIGMFIWIPTIMAIDAIEKRKGGKLHSYELLEKWHRRTKKEWLEGLLLAIIVAPIAIFLSIYVIPVVDKILDFFVQLIFWGIFFGIAGFIMLIGKIFHL